MRSQIGVQRDPSTVKATFGRIEALTSKVRSVRATGSCAMNMCGVAMGRLDAFYEIGFGGPWDCAAAAIVVREAGGMVRTHRHPPLCSTDRPLASLQQQ